MKIKTLKKIVMLALMIGVITTLTGCSKQEKTLAGIGLGALTGAAIGSIAGGSVGGAAIGAGVGGLTGGLIGNSMGNDN